MNAHQLPSLTADVLAFDSKHFEGSPRERQKARAKVIARARKTRALAERLMLQRRWLRKARGRLSAKDVLELAELQQDSAYRWGFWGPDRVAQRTPGWLARDVAEAKDHPGRQDRVERDLAELRSQLSHTFWWYGPTGGSAGIWPGDRLVYDPEALDCTGRKGCTVVIRGNG